MSNKRVVPTPRIYDPAAFARIRETGRIVGQILDAVRDWVAPGITPIEIDAFVADLAAAKRATQPLKGRNGYPFGISVSPNSIVCNGLPTDVPLKDGDIVNVAICLLKDGYHAYADSTFQIGDVPVKAKRLCDIARESMFRGIAATGPGKTTLDIGRAIQTFAESERCSVVRDFCGRGIGVEPFEQPSILHYVEPSYSIKLVPGLVFTIQPMINLGRPAVKVLADGWTAVSRDRSLSAEFGHTVGVTANGVEILSQC